MKYISVIYTKANQSYHYVTAVLMYCIIAGKIDNCGPIIKEYIFTHRHAQNDSEDVHDDEVLLRPGDQQVIHVVLSYPLLVDGTSSSTCQYGCGILLVTFRDDQTKHIRNRRRSWFQCESKSTPGNIQGSVPPPPPKFSYNPLYRNPPSHFYDKFNSRSWGTGDPSTAPCSPPTGVWCSPPRRTAQQGSGDSTVSWSSRWPSRRVRSRARCSVQTGIGS